MTGLADKNITTDAAILIAGPTASGKSSLAVEIALAFDGIVINADSMQVYKDLAVLTARPSTEERAGVTHRLFGHIDAAESYSVADWHDQAMREVHAAWSDARLPILVGGTGLYFHAILEGLAPVPTIAKEIRDDVRKQRDLVGADGMYEILCREDPGVATRLQPADGQRVSRALEVIRATGESLDYWQSRTEPGGLAEQNEAGRIVKLVLGLDRSALYARIEERFDTMLETGALDEVGALAARQLDGDLPAMKALGVPQLIAALKGDQSENEAVAHSKQQTRRYAKRQMTWFRNRFSDWDWIDAQYSERKKDEIFSKIRNLMLTLQE